ncbi:MAG: leucine-rich repeat domain-containing protein [Muribaculaceae bacterium]|nr:leucine-rich repeat domain-containing protein [Muribaculaceae bacterium]
MMQTFIQKIMLLALMAISSIPAYSKIDFFDYDGMKYSFNDETQTVTVYGFSDDNKNPPANIEIPSIVEYEGIRYLVTKVKFIKEENYKYLESVIFPSSITSIDGFDDCPNLRSINFPSSVTTIRGFFKFYPESVNFPSSVTSINGFDYCPNLSSINFSFPSSVTSIEGFDDCPNLHFVSFPSSVTTIQGFRKCYLHSIDFPPSVESIIGFDECPYLDSVTFPSSLKYLGNFYKCNSLHYIFLPASLEKVYGNAFHQCVNLRTIIVEKSNNELFFEPIGDVSQQLMFAKDLTIGRPIKLYEGTSPYSAPFDALNFNSLVVMEDVDVQNINSFRRFRKEPGYDITLGKNAKLLPDDCSKWKIKTLTLADVEPPVCPTFSKEQYDTLQLFVPAEGIEAYRQAEGWKNFFNLKVSGIEEIENTSERTVIARLDLHGRPVREDYKGIVIERYSDGTAGKVLVK